MVYGSSVVECKEKKTILVYIAIDSTEWKVFSFKEKGERWLTFHGRKCAQARSVMRVLSSYDLLQSITFADSCA